MNILKRLSLLCALVAIVGAPVSTVQAKKVLNPDFSVTGECLLTGAIVGIGCIGLIKTTEKATKASSKLVGKVIDREKRPALYKTASTALMTTTGLLFFQLYCTVKTWHRKDNLWKSCLERIGLGNYLRENQYIEPKDPNPTDPNTPQASNKPQTVEQKNLENPNCPTAPDSDECKCENHKHVPAQKQDKK